MGAVVDIKVELTQVGELDLDQIHVNGRRVGLVPHAAGAIVRFVRLLKPEEQEAIRQELARIRQERGQPGIGEGAMQAPDPDAIRSFEAKRKGKQQ